MAGRPQGAEARSLLLQVRMTRPGMEALDKMRGPLSRSAFIRVLLAKEAKTHGS